MVSLVESLRPGGRIDDWQGRSVHGVFLDVDGTTLGTHTQPTPTLLDAARAVQDAGLWLSFATGRPPAGLDVLRPATGSPGPFIVHNGAQVLFDRAPAQTWPLSARALRTVARWCSDRGVYAEFAVGDGLLVTDFREAARPSWDEVAEPDGLVGDVDLVALGSCKITIVAFEPELLPELLALCATLDVHVDPSSAPIFPGITIVNVTAACVSKGSAVEWVARWFRARDKRVAILSRGYGDAAGTGLNDEGRVLEENLPDVPHLQNKDRVAQARIAEEELASEILVLDDGFQHRRLARDLDIVLLDALDPFGLDRIFPRGLLREPISSLRRAGVVVLSRADLVDAPTRAAIRARAENLAGPLQWAEARHAPLDLIDAGGGSYPLAELTDRKVAAFCGIGNPDGFARTLGNLGVHPVAFRSFPDHHAYTAADIADLADWVLASGADLALTTQKDLVKVRLGALGPAPLRALRIGWDLLEGRDAIEGALAAILPPE